MAGAGKKTFTAGETLTASDVNTYLMEQSVMVFGGTAARSSAIPTPTEGMFAVTTDNDELDYYDGSAWVPALPVGEWQSWAPTLSGGWANGNGTWTARYVQIGKTIHASGIFTIGSTTTKGTNLIVSLPVTMFNQSMLSGFHARGSISSIIYPLFMISSSTSAIQLVVGNAASTYSVTNGVTATVPATWATGDAIVFGVTYQAA